MTLIKKRDVKEHFAARRRSRSHQYVPPSQPDATGLIGKEPVVIPAKPSGLEGFGKDFVGEHSSPGKSIAPGADGGREAD